MAAAAQPGEAVPAELARRGLCRVLEQYGLALCADPWRFEALLRDLCGGSRREIFWLVSALKENILGDIQAGLGQTPDGVLVARLAHKLEDGLGLAPAPAQWTAAAWLEAVRLAPASTPAPDLERVIRPALPVWPDPDAPPAPMPETTTSAAARPDDNPLAPSAKAPLAVPPGTDARWLALCLAGVVLSALALAVTARVAFYPAAMNPKAWLRQTGWLVGGLGVCGLGEFALAWTTARWKPRRRPALAQAAWALLPELLLLLSQPAVLVGVPLLWFGGWWGATHYFGPQPSFVFHLGRLLQTLLLAVFYYNWAGWMTRVQGQVATTLVGTP